MDFAIWLTNECNMACKYCYVDGKKGTTNFPENDVFQLVQFIKESSINENKIKINFFGGEPLLNFRLIQVIVDQIEVNISTTVEYYLTTNGLLLNEKIADYFAEKEMFISLSWDGCELANDKNRVDKGGMGTYQRIKVAYRLLKNAGLDNVRVRATFNSETAKYLKESIEDFLGEDANMIAIFVPDYFDKNWSEETIMDVENAMAHLSSKGIHTISILGEVNREKCSCGGGILNFHICTDGMIYPCSFATYEEQFCIGDIWKGLNKKKIKDLEKNYYSPISECNGCDYAEYCLSNKCRYLNWSLTKMFNKPAPVVCQFENLKWCSSNNYNR